MPGPPPAGVSSTERCLSRANPRMSTASSRQSPASSALPASDTPSGPGNISGKSVRTLADHASVIVLLRLAVPERAGRRIDHDPPARNVDLGDILVREAHQHRLAAFGGRDLEEVARPEILDPGDAAIIPAIQPHRTEADEVGIVPALLITTRPGQTLARHIKLRASERRRHVAVIHPFELAD